MATETVETRLESLRRLTRDLKNATKTLSPKEVRFLVDTYYQFQENRKVADNQVLSMQASGEPHEVITWLSDNNSILERNIKTMLDAHTSGNPVGRWAKSIVGIGPVIAAGLAAHIDITRAPTVGHIWRFAGLDSTVIWSDAETCGKWLKEHDEKDVDQLVVIAAKHWGRDSISLRRIATTDFSTGEVVPLTMGRLAKALARRPWNARLKTLCWKIGESFVKFSNHEDDFYGKLWRERKAIEEANNVAKKYADQAAAKLERFNIGRGTDAYKAYAQGLLPPAHIHARSKRWAVKLFLAHWHHVAFNTHFNAPPPKPYILSREMGHTHEIVAPNWPMAA